MCGLETASYCGQLEGRGGQRAICLPFLPFLYLCTVELEHSIFNDRSQCLRIDHEVQSTSSVNSDSDIFEFPPPFSLISRTENRQVYVSALRLDFNPSQLFRRLSAPCLSISHQQSLHQGMRHASYCQRGSHSFAWSHALSRDSIAAPQCKQPSRVRQLIFKLKHQATKECIDWLVY